MVRCYPQPEKSAIWSFGCQTYLVGEVQERKGKLHSKKAMLEVNLESEIRGRGIIRNILLPIAGSDR